MECSSKLSKVARRERGSPIQELSHLAQRCGAINLAEGLPDFPAPRPLKDAAIDAINSDLNQYRHVQGACDMIAKLMKESQGLDVNPLTDVAICCGQTEAFAAAVLTTIDPGDEVLLFDPSYETYESCILMAGGVPVYVSLEPPHWALDTHRFLKSFSPKTKAVVLNSPQNPTGKVFSREELKVIAEACCKKDCLAITDEVYEFIIFETQVHMSLASFPGMKNRTIITSSLSKTFSVTGWRVGWAVAPPCFASAIRNIHVKLTDSAPAPFQEAAVTALRSPSECFESLRKVRPHPFSTSIWKLQEVAWNSSKLMSNFLLGDLKDYEAKRDFMIDMLQNFGFHIVFKPQGSFFVFVELPENCMLSDVEFVRELIEKVGVAAVPGRGFFHTSGGSRLYQQRYIRFAFCKSMATLQSAARRMAELMKHDNIFTKFE